MRNIVVISAHPDDEILGVGGTLLKHKKNGDKIYWLITTNIFENQGFSKERISSRQKEIKKISEALSVEKVFMLDYPTMSLSTSSLIEMVPKYQKYLLKLNPR